MECAKLKCQLILETMKYRQDFWRIWNKREAVIKGPTWYEGWGIVMQAKACAGWLPPAGQMPDLDYWLE